MRRRLVLWAIAAVVLSSPCLAGPFDIPIYINGTGNYGGNNPFSASGIFVAQDFVLESGAALTGLSFNAYTTKATVPISAVNVQLYSDSGGTVGAQLFSGEFLVASEAVTGTADGYTLKDFFVTLPGWDLAAGHYWIGLRVDPAQVDMHWTIPTSTPLGYSGYYGNASGDPDAYTTATWDHSFTLFGGDGGPADVPEPSSAALSLTGAALIGLYARSKR